LLNTVEAFSEHPGQGGQLIRLRQIGNTRFRFFVELVQFGAVTAGYNHSQLRILLSEFPRQIETRYPLGHHHVRQEQRNIQLVLIPLPQGVHPVYGNNDAISEALKPLNDNLSDRFIVLHEQNGFMAMHGLFGSHCGVARLRGVASRNKDAEQGAFPNFTLNFDPAAMLFYNAKNGGKAQPCSLAHFLGGKERFKNLPSCLLIHS